MRVDGFRTAVHSAESIAADLPVRNQPNPRIAYRKVDQIDAEQGSLPPELIQATPSPWDSPAVFRADREPLQLNDRDVVSSTPPLPSMFDDRKASVPPVAHDRARAVVAGYRVRRLMKTEEFESLLRKVKDIEMEIGNSSEASWTVWMQTELTRAKRDCGEWLRKANKSDWSVWAFKQIEESLASSVSLETSIKSIDC